MLAAPGDLDANHTAVAVADLRGVVENWRGDDGLRAKTLDFLSRASTRSIASYLRSLRATHIVTAEQVDAWNSVRHRVMHGEILEPWLNEETEKRLHSLLGLTHALARAYVDSQFSALAAEMKIDNAS
jgi:hypothetical protein